MHKKHLAVCFGFLLSDIMCIYCRIASYCIMINDYSTVLIHFLSIFVQLHLLLGCAHTHKEAFFNV